ncbi:YbaB/EbfC family nucleoid-associated protein [Rhodococcus wratislaviensis]|uniref:YbaB/EbfC family nucleoid-associated protein n=1 Tax=Rhodococcus wratislaviensis TaxID=44752 RepID=UPI003654167F
MPNLKDLVCPERFTDQIRLGDDDERLEGATASIAESSESDPVAAAVDGKGTLTDLWMDDSISTLNARTLATMITSTTQEAARLATGQRNRVMTTLQDGFGKV